MNDDRFKLEHDGECRYDFLQVREGESLICSGVPVTETQFSDDNVIRHLIRSKQ